MVQEIDIDDVPRSNGGGATAARPRQTKPNAKPKQARRVASMPSWSAAEQMPASAKPARSTASSADADEDVYGDRRGVARGPNSAQARRVPNAKPKFRFTDDNRDSLLQPDTSLLADCEAAVAAAQAQAGQPRQSEYGSSVMQNDDGYRCTAINQRRNANDGLTPLLQAAREGDVMLLNTLIVQPGTDILRRDPVYGQTALHFAIRGGHLAVVQALVMPELAGSIVNIPDSRRNTALHLAAAKSRRMSKILIDAGADVNFLNMRNQTPLGVHILTATRDDPSMTEILLQGRANPNAPVDTSTLLHVALDKKLYQIAQRLVRHGARLDLKDQAGRMVFDKVDQRMLKMLLSKVSFEPVWVPDRDRINCMECQKAFGSIGARRHHCRYCGRLLCAKCTPHHLRQTELPFPSHRKSNQARKKQRVCKMCFEIFMEGDAASAATASSSNPVNFANSV